MRRKTYRIRIEAQTGGRFTVVKYAQTAEQARAQVALPAGCRIVSTSQQRA